MKNQKGVTLTVLVATVVIMAIIVGSISYNSVSGVKMRAYYNMCADIELLDEKIALYYLERGKLPILEEDSTIIYELINNYSETDVNYNPNNSEILHKIDLSKLDNMSLNYTEYYIDQTSHTIYSSRGMEVGEDVYYTSPADYQKVDLALYR